METKLEVAIASPGKGLVMNTVARVPSDRSPIFRQRGANQGSDPAYDMAQAPAVLPRAPKYLCQVVNALVAQLFYGFTDSWKTKSRRGSGPKLWKLCSPEGGLRIRSPARTGDSSPLRHITP